VSNLSRIVLDVISFVTPSTRRAIIATEQKRVLMLNIKLTSWKLAMKEKMQMKRRKHPTPKY
jgi:hypothetical protein